MLHKPAQQLGPEHAVEFKSRLGVRMFVVYAIIYAGFVAINVIRPVLMEKTVFFGLNLAVTYGFGLIVLALVLALIYNHSCGREEGIQGRAATEREG
ncbi:MAG: DUF485 domain-containing protein [Candidatus Eisenbacteria bacterium]|nr:DUF485 domain-containing protein [Candidatus Eisenbacteria bacterium]